ncbi:MAG: hypothetical protein WCA00_06260 [Candidatus Acidiferrales bacterium]
MGSSALATVTGSSGTYQWLATGLHDLDSFLLRCPKTLAGKYVAVTSLDSGALRLTEGEERTGWRSRGGVAYSPQVRSVETLRHGGFDEWYIFDSPKELGQVWQGNVFELPSTSDYISVFVNFGDFAPHNPAVEALVALFWKQLDQIQPESYVADGNQFLTFASRDQQLFAEVCKALADAPANA